jgi:hypothetical protein
MIHEVYVFKIKFFVARRRAKMKRVIITMLFASLLLGVAGMDAAAQNADVIILTCRVAGWVEGDVRPIIVDGCSTSNTSSYACPTAPLTSCAVQLQTYINQGFKIEAVQQYMDGALYTLKTWRHKS